MKDAPAGTAGSFNSPESPADKQNWLLLIIFLQPIQFLAQLDVSVPWILVQAVSLAGKYEERVRYTKRLERAFHGDSLQVAYAYIRGALDQMCRRLHFVESKQRGLTLIKLRILPGLAAKIPRIVPCLVVIAPVGRVLHCPRTSDRGAKARGLRN